VGVRGGVDGGAEGERLTGLMFVDVALALDALGEGEARLGPEWIEHGGERVLGALECARADRRERGLLSRRSEEEKGCGSASGEDGRRWLCRRGACYSGMSVSRARQGDDNWQ
jgi:hypothetical protein